MTSVHRHHEQPRQPQGPYGVLHRLSETGRAHQVAIHDDRLRASVSSDPALDHGDVPVHPVKHGRQYPGGVPRRVDGRLDNNRRWPAQTQLSQRASPRPQRGLYATGRGATNFKAAICRIIEQRGERAFYRLRSSPVQDSTVSGARSSLHQLGGANAALSSLPAPVAPLRMWLGVSAAIPSSRAAGWRRADGPSARRPYLVDRLRPSIAPRAAARVVADREIGRGATDRASPGERYVVVG